MLSWFAGNDKETGLPVCRIKNGFAAAAAADQQNEYSDIKVFVVVTGAGGLRIIGEIQIHDINLFLLKRKVRALLSWLMASQ